MRKVQCYECRKTYDYDEDGFCPRCGAFNQPAAISRIGADGAVVRVDGINERNHRESFVHRELHEEKQERRKYGLDKSVQRIQNAANPPTRSKTAVRQRPKNTNLASAIIKIVFAIIALNFLSNLLVLFF